MKLDAAQFITALALLIPAVTGSILSLRRSGGTYSENQKDAESAAISVTRIGATEKMVDTMREQVDYLLRSVGVLEQEKNKLVAQVNVLTSQLEKERGDHKNTKARLDALLVEITIKNEKIAVLEQQVKKLKEVAK